MKRVETTKQHINLSFIYFVASLAIFFVSAYVTTILNYGWTPLFVGVGLMAVAVVVHYFAKDFYQFYTLSFSLNMIASGLSFGTLFVLENLVFDVKSMLVVFLSGVVIAFVYSRAYLALPYQKYKIINLILGSITGFTGVILAVLWLGRPQESIYGFMVAMLVYQAIYLGLLNYIVKRGNQYRYISFYSFGVYIVITAIVLVVLSDGELFPADLLTPDKQSARRNQPRL